MAENELNPQSELRPEPELRQTKEQPKGVLQKNLKTFVYLGAALLVIVAAFFSSSSKKTPSQQATKGQPPQPMLQDNTDNNVRDLRNQVQADRSYRCGRCGQGRNPQGVRQSRLPGASPQKATASGSDRCR